MPLIKDLAWGTKLWTENPELFFLSEYFRRKRARNARSPARNGEIWSALPDECRVDLHEPRHFQRRRWCPGMVVAGKWHPVDPPPAGPEVWKIIVIEATPPGKPAISPDHARPGLILVPGCLSDQDAPQPLRLAGRALFIPIRGETRYNYPWFLAVHFPPTASGHAGGTFDFTAPWGVSLSALVDYRRSLASCTLANEDPTVGTTLDAARRLLLMSLGLSPDNVRLGRVTDQPRIAPSEVVRIYYGPKPGWLPSVVISPESLSNHRIDAIIALQCVPYSTRDDSRRTLSVALGSGGHLLDTSAAWSVDPLLVRGITRVHSEHLVRSMSPPVVLKTDAPDVWRDIRASLEVCYA